MSDLERLARLAEQVQHLEAQDKIVSELVARAARLTELAHLVNAQPSDGNEDNEVVSLIGIDPRLVHAVNSSGVLEYAGCVEVTVRQTLYDDGDDARAVDVLLNDFCGITVAMSSLESTQGHWATSTILPLQSMHRSSDTTWQAMVPIATRCHTLPLRIEVNLVGLLPSDVGDDRLCSVQLPVAVRERVLDVLHFISADAGGSSASALQHGARNFGAADDLSAFLKALIAPSPSSAPAPTACTSFSVDINTIVTAHEGHDIYPQLLSMLLGDSSCDISKIVQSADQAKFVCPLLPLRPEITVRLTAGSPLTITVTSSSHTVVHQVQHALLLRLQQLLQVASTGHVVTAQHKKHLDLTLDDLTAQVQHLADLYQNTSSDATELRHAATAASQLLADVTQMVQ
ncbi:hypothetical protein RI367_005462 [Sorochytrium milnesiophthora]